MPAEDLDVDPKPRSVLAALLRPTGFRLLLPGGTVPGIEAAARDAEVPRSYRLTVRDGVLVLRYYGGGGISSPTWSVKGRLEQTGDGVRLEGRLRYLLDRLATGMFVVFTLFLFGVAAVLAVQRGPGDGDVRGAFLAGLVMSAPTGLLLFLMPGVAARRSTRAAELLHGALLGD